MNALEVKDIKKEKGNVIKREKLSFFRPVGFADWFVGLLKIF